jgi:hypothetical protein
MRFKVGTNVCVKNVYSGGNFENGDIVTITQIGDGDGDLDCYGAISPWDGLLWYLRDNEVEAATNADHIRSMGDDELAKFLYSVEFRRSITGGGAMWEDISDCLHWLKSAKSE